MSAPAPPRLGERLPPLVIAAVSAEKMKTTSALLDDPTPIHFDRGAVERQGLGERPVNQGPLALGYALELIGRWRGDAGAAARIRCRFLDNVFAGERLECRGEVVALDAEAGTCEVAIEIESDGRRVGSGAATVRIRPGA